MNNDIPRLLRFEDLKNLFKVSRSSLARWEKSESDPFPKRVNIGENSIGWREDEVKTWLAHRIKR